jgi:TPP-dependent pyruvate/acetoin dehydrogenase alpha subunit
VVFIIQNNQVALGTRVAVHHAAENFDGLSDAYGVSGWSFAGNNVLDAYAATRLAAEECREGEGPVILSAETFRMGGHATHDEAEARVVIPAGLFEYWGARDPIGLYEEHLKADGVSTHELERLELEVTAEIEEAEREALISKERNLPRGETALEGVYSDG